MRQQHNVIIWHGGTGQFFADLIGIWRLGACAVCLNPSTTQEEIERIIKFVDAAAILDAGSHRLDLKLGSKILDSSAFEGSGMGTLGHSQLDDNAIILFTSGTTGTPKGVVHSFRSLLARVSLNQTHLSQGILTRTLSVLPTHFGHGLIGNCLTPLLGGHPLVLAPATNLDVSVKELRQWCTGRLAREKIPSRWFIIDDIPKTDRGKINRDNVATYCLTLES